MGSSEDERRVISLLLKAGADINLVNEEETPLSGYYLESCHFDKNMKLMINHVKKLQTAKLPISQKMSSYG
ncbi:MAG: hypothetical protein ACR5KV_07215 [Wolbachia sp.]